MKTLLLFSFLLFITLVSNAQFTTNGDGAAYNFTQLSEETTQITLSGNNITLSGLVTLAASDSLIITTIDTLFLTSDGALRIEGVILAQPTSIVTFTAVDSTLGYEGLTLDESNSSIIQNIHFQYGGGIKLLYSDAQVKHCRFYKMTNTNGSGAIEMLGSNPVIDSCEFIMNARAAISSSATASSSPKILNCHLYKNNTENGNRPQINLGTSDGENEIIIRKNTIKGFYDRAGGISLATLAGGSISAIIENNTVTNNRYGLNVQGNVVAEIIGNKFIGNNIENNPMSGGSGISFYSGAQATVKHNIITENLWGITIPSEANPNLGQIGIDTINIGHNYIFNNSQSGTIYNLYNNSPAEIYAQNNYWGTTSAVEAGEWIVDNADDPSLGVVIYEPIYTLNSDNQFDEFYVLVNEIPTVGIIDHETSEIHIDVPTDYNLSAVTPYFTASEYASVLVGIELQTSGQNSHDFTDSVLYAVISEDSTQAHYTVYIHPAISTNDLQKRLISLHPNPTHNYLHIKTVSNYKQITIYDSFGRLTLTHSKAEIIDVTHLKKGFYFIKIHFDDANTYIQKFIKN